MPGIWYRHLGGEGQDVGPSLPTGVDSRMEWALDADYLYVLPWTAAASSGTKPIHRFGIAETGFAAEHVEITGPNPTATWAGNYNLNALNVADGKLLISGYRNGTGKHMHVWSAATPVAAGASWTDAHDGPNNNAQGAACFALTGGEDPYGRGAHRSTTPPTRVLQGYQHDDGQYFQATDGWSGSGQIEVLHGVSGDFLTASGDRVFGRGGASTGSGLHLCFVNADGSLHAYRSAQCGVTQAGGAAQSHLWIVGDRVFSIVANSGKTQQTVHHVDRDGNTPWTGAGPFTNLPDATFHGGVAYDDGTGVRSYIVRENGQFWRWTGTGYSFEHAGPLGGIPDLTLDGGEKAVLLAKLPNGALYVLTDSGSAYALDFAVPEAPGVDTEERFVFKRMREDPSDPGSFGFLSDLGTITSSGDADGFAKENVQAFDGRSIGAAWRSTSATFAWLEIDLGAEVPLNWSQIAQAGSAGLDDDGVQILFRYGLAPDPSTELEVDTADLTGDWWRMFEGVTARYVRWVFTHPTGNATGYFQVARLACDDWNAVTVNFQDDPEEALVDESRTEKLGWGAELDVVGPVRLVTSLDFEAIGARAGDLEAWRELVAFGRNRASNRRPGVPFWACPDPLRALAGDLPDDEEVGFYPPRFCTLDPESRVRKVGGTRDPVFAAQLRLRQVV